MHPCSLTWVQWLQTNPFNTITFKAWCQRSRLALALTAHSVRRHVKNISGDQLLSDGNQSHFMRGTVTRPLLVADNTDLCLQVQCALIKVVPAVRCLWNCSPLYCKAHGKSLNVVRKSCGMVCDIWPLDPVYFCQPNWNPLLLRWLSHVTDQAPN